MKLTSAFFKTQRRSINLINRRVRVFLARRRKERWEKAIVIQSGARMWKFRRPFNLIMQEKKRKEEQIKLIEEQKKKIEVLRMKKEAVRVIEREWGLYLLKKELIEKKRMWDKLPLDCRLLWARFSNLKQQTYGLSEKIKEMNRNMD
mmetsp:Transcript_22244/g.21486  ORF Transcript_22244/g.21486 Transcript_22244/m.21486 type:complete len:147 (-) Transcript_22244:39-479(-)